MKKILSCTNELMMRKKRGNKREWKVFFHSENIQWETLFSANGPLFRNLSDLQKLLLLLDHIRTYAQLIIQLLLPPTSFVLLARYSSNFRVICRKQAFQLCTCPPAAKVARFDDMIMDAGQDEPRSEFTAPPYPYCHMDGWKDSQNIALLYILKWSSYLSLHLLFHI